MTSGMPPSSQNNTGDSTPISPNSSVSVPHVAIPVTSDQYSRSSRLVI